METNTERTGTSFTVRRNESTRKQRIYISVFVFLVAGYIVFFVGFDGARAMYNAVAFAIVLPSSLILTIAAMRWQIKVEGEAIYYRPLFRKRSLTVHDIKGFSTESNERISVTNVYSVGNKRLFTIISPRDEGYDLFMNYLAEWNVEFRKKEPPKAVSAQERVIKEKHLWKFQIWLSAIASVLAVATIAGTVMLQSSLLGLRLTLFGSLTMLLIFLAGNVYIILSLMRELSPSAKNKRHLIVGSHIVLAIAVLLGRVIGGNIGIPGVIFLLGSCFTLLVSAKLAGSALITDRKVTMALAYLFAVTAALYMLGQGVSQMRILERELVRTTTIEINDESIYQVGREVIALVEEYLSAHISAVEAETALLEVLSNDLPRVTTGARLTRDEDRIRWLAMRFTSFVGEDRDEVVEYLNELRELLDRPRR